MTVHQPRSAVNWTDPIPSPCSTRPGAARGQLTTSGYDLFNHHFPIRDAPDLLILHGETSRPWRNKWVAVIEPAGGDPGFTIRRLFPLEWDPDRNRHFFGGPGVFLRDAQGAAIIHATAIHDGAGLLPGNALIVRRDYPTGHLRWEYRLDNQITALDADGARIVATTHLGELLILHADDGSLVHRQHLRLNGHAIVPLSLRIADPNRAWVGTYHGRILEIDLSTTGDS